MTSRRNNKYLDNDPETIFLQIEIRHKFTIPDEIVDFITNESFCSRLLTLDEIDKLPVRHKIPTVYKQRRDPEDTVFNRFGTHFSTAHVVHFVYTGQTPINEQDISHICHCHMCVSYLHTVVGSNALNVMRNKCQVFEIIRLQGMFRIGSLTNFLFRKLLRNYLDVQV